MSSLIPVSAKDKANTSADVVFIHGVGGHPVQTWQADGKPESFWPKWLDDDLPHATVWTAEYEASPSAWLGSAMPLTDRATNMLALLTANGIGSRPLVFITHSLGGLLVKQAMRTADSYGQQSWRRLLANTRGVLFLATPHTGTDLTSYLGALQQLFRLTDLALELDANAAPLRDLNLWFRNNIARFGVASQVCFEKRNTRGVRVVDEASSDPGLPGLIPIPIDADHLDMLTMERCLYTELVTLGLTLFKHYGLIWIDLVTLEDT